MKRESCVLHPHAFFKTKSVVASGSRDKRGRFVKAEIILKSCPQEEADYMTGFVMMCGSFVLAKRSIGNA